MTTVTVFMFAVWLPNLKLIGTIILSSSVPTIEKMGFLLSLLGSIKTNFTPISASYTIAIAVLFGVNIALLSYYIQDRQSSAVGSGATLSIGGLASGVLGIGCA
ncbi:MAG: hypothetical protein GWN41_06190, partial [Phycisphaerae bacterium]|nr:hypothetical protein [Phycisphaerae bacterium]